MNCEELLYILCFVDLASLHNNVNKTNLVHNLFFVYFISLYMFRVSLGPSSKEQLYLYDTWYLLFRIPPCIPASQLYRITSTKCLINTVVLPDDWPKEARNM